MTDRDSEKTILAYLQHKAGERRVRYVAQGRRFQALPNEALETRWATAFVALCIEAQPESVGDLDDLSSEIALRGRPMPAHLVQRLLPDVQERVVGPAATSLVMSFARRVRAFIREQAEPRGKS